MFDYSQQIKFTLFDCPQKNFALDLGVPATDQKVGDNQKNVNSKSTYIMLLVVS